MKKMMISLVGLFMMCGFQSYALEWHDYLISTLMTLPIRDKQVVVERDEKYLTIKRASYRFSFQKMHVANDIKTILYQHSTEAIKFSSENGVVIMQVVEQPDTYYTYKFTENPDTSGRYVLLISVNAGKPGKLNDQ